MKRSISLNKKYKSNKFYKKDPSIKIENIKFNIFDYELSFFNLQLKKRKWYNIVTIKGGDYKYILTKIMNSKFRQIYRKMIYLNYYMDYLRQLNFLMANGR